jgi:hypothetical protein
LTPKAGTIEIQGSSADLDDHPQSANQAPAMNAKWWLALAVAAIVVGACSTRPEALSTPPELFFPQLPPPSGPRVNLLASLSGTLTVEDGCLWLRTPATRHLLVWRQAHALGWSEGRSVILQEGGVVARVGDRVAVGGGEVNMRDVPVGGNWLEAQVGGVAPAACRAGPFWIVGGVERLSST